MMIVMCPDCRGKGSVSGLGGMSKQCLLCYGIGKIEQEEVIEVIEEPIEVCPPEEEKPVPVNTKKYKNHEERLAGRRKNRKNKHKDTFDRFREGLIKGEVIDNA